MTEHRILHLTGHLALPLSRADLDELAWAIDADGLARHEQAARRVAEQARRVGLTTPLVEVMTDDATPMPVRERAFGKVAYALAQAAGSSPEWALAN